MITRRVSLSLAAAALVVSVGVPVPGGAVPAGLQVVESIGTAAVAGVVSRLPAESAGGVVFADTLINLDKARGTAAGATGGNLVEIFFGTSSSEYRNPTLARSQHPPTAAEAEEATAETGVAGPAGVTGVFTTRSTGQPSSVASATAKTVTSPLLEITGGYADSAGTVTDDEIVLTEVTARSASIVVGGVVTFDGVRSVATAKVAPDGTPEANVETTVAGITVNGVAARITDEGLEVADQPPVGAQELVDFNAGLARLRDQGLTIAGVPTDVVTEPGRARAGGAVAVVRYQIPVLIPNSIGNDEEILLGQVVAAATARRRTEEPPLPALDPEVANVDVPGPATSGQAAPATPAADGSVSTRPIRPAVPRRSGLATPAHPFLATPPGGGAQLSVPESRPAGDGRQVADNVGGDQSAADLFARPSGGADPSEQLRSGYGSFILAALAATALFLARQRTRLV